jgi:hypothetical protein
MEEVAAKVVESGAVGFPGKVSDGTTRWHVQQQYYDSKEGEDEGEQDPVVPEQAPPGAESHDEPAEKRHHGQRDDHVPAGQLPPQTMDTLAGPDSGISGAVLSPHSVHPDWGAREESEYVCLRLEGGPDGTAGDITRLTRHGASAEFEDELPVRQFVTLVGLLDDIGQLAGIQLGVPPWSALGRCGHAATVPRTA